MNLSEIIETYCHWRQQDEITRSELAEDYLIATLEEKFPESVFKEMLIKKSSFGQDKVDALIVDLLCANNIKNWPMLKIFLPAIRECYKSKKGLENKPPADIAYYEGDSSQEAGGSR